jgi:tetratricopeptide (TPR) repeat protein
VLSTYYLSLGYIFKAKDAVEPVIQLALDLNYQKRLSAIYTAIGMNYVWNEEDFSRGKQYLNKVFDIASKVGDFLALWFVNQQLGGAICYDYQFDEGLTYLKTALDLSVMSKNPLGISAVKGILSISYNYQGNTNLALQTSTETLQTALGSGDIVAMQIAYTSQGVSYFYKGHFLEAEKHFLEAMTIYKKTSGAAWGAYAAGGLGWAYGDMKEYEKSGRYHDKCISITEDARFFPSWLNVHKLFLAKAKILNHDSDIDLHDVNILIANHEKNKLAVCESLGTRCIAEIYMNIDDQHMAESETWIKRAMDFNTKHDTKWELARDHALYSIWFKKQGDISKARVQLATAIALFKECGADGWVEKYEKELTRI